MAQLEIDIDLSGAMRRGMIKSLADVVDAFPQYRMAVILELLRRDDTTRCMLAEDFGERAIAETKADATAAARYEAAKGENVEPPHEKSWDEIILESIKDLLDTPGGRGEA